MYRIVLAEQPAEMFAQADRPLATKLARCFAQLQDEPRRNNDIKRLTGKLDGLYRYRVGDWRVIYEIAEAESRVDVIPIAHRKDVYE